MNDRLSIRSRRFLSQVWQLAAPYWRSEEKPRAWLLLSAIVAMTFGIVYMLGLLNEWNRQFFNALESKNSEDFFALMLQARARAERRYNGAGCAVMKSDRRKVSCGQ